MINIEIKKASSSICEVTISGHANFDSSGKDIVCAAVSSMAILTANAIVKFDSEAIIVKESDGFLNIKVLKFDNTTALLLKNLIEHLLSLEKDYKKYIKIKTQEVY